MICGNDKLNFLAGIKLVQLQRLKGIFRTYSQQRLIRGNLDKEWILDKFLVNHHRSITGLIKLAKSYLNDKVDRWGRLAQVRF